MTYKLVKGLDLCLLILKPEDVADIPENILINKNKLAMKASFTSLLCVAVLLFGQSCTKEDAGSDPTPMESKTGNERLADTGTASGKLFKLQVTSFMYGTHGLQISPTSTDSIIVLKSSLNLDAFIDKNVTVSGNMVEGYPIEGGPALFNVTTVEESK